MPLAVSNDDQGVPVFVKFLIGGISGIGAILFVHPLDLIKYRMQINGEGGKPREYRTSFQAFGSVVKKEGFSGLYAGSSANLLRQATDTTARWGVFQLMTDQFNNLGYTGFYSQVAAGFLAGCVGVILATPSDVALVRMALDEKLPSPEKRNYKHVLDAMSRITKEEGRTGMFAGYQPTVLRRLIGNTVLFVSYMQTKTFIVEKGYLEDNIACHFVSSLVSGFVYTFVTCPIDVAKTRMQNMKGGRDPPMYSSAFDAIHKTVQKEGVTALWKGFGPQFAKIVPHTALLLLFAETLTSLYRKKVMGVPPGGIFG